MRPGIPGPKKPQIIRNKNHHLALFEGRVLRRVLRRGSKKGFREGTSKQKRANAAFPESTTPPGAPYVRAGVVKRRTSYKPQSPELLSVGEKYRFSGYPGSRSNIGRK